MKKTIFTLALISSLAVASCTKVDQPETDRNQEELPYVLDTRSFSELTAKDFQVTGQEASLYAFIKSRNYFLTYDQTGVLDSSEVLLCNPDQIDIKAYPDFDAPDIFILNYPNDTWEILSADKRTSIVLASGNGKFSMDDKEHEARTAWVKDLAQEINALHDYNGEIKNAEERYGRWQLILYEASYLKEEMNELGCYYNPYPNHLTKQTRSSAEPDTSYHPVPGHYVPAFTQDNCRTIEQRTHLTSTLWSQLAPYNQYCPMDFETHNRAKAGSDAVAGAQMVYYIHRNGDAWPPIYRTGYCEAYITDPMDWTAMDQFDQSEDNWLLFQTADSTRMASVMIANIGERMMLNYGLNYTGGNFADLQTVLLSEYGIESFMLPFNGGDVNPYEEIMLMLHSGLPSIVHTGYGESNTQPHTFIVDGYKRERHSSWLAYSFEADDLNWDGHLITESMFQGYVYETYFCMNWGTGYNDNDWYVNSSDWHHNNLDYSNRQALMSFRMDGSNPGDDVE